jgi:predicted RNase H-like nuclease (RuvC/YqgF family)
MSEDLYSDLIEITGASGETLVRTQNMALRKKVKLYEEEIAWLKSRLRRDEQSQVHLRKENSTLERNISCLYNTAVMVFARYLPFSTSVAHLL